MLQVRKIDLTTLLGQTIKWNKVANLGEFDFSQERKDLQFKCLKEEFDELLTAIRDDDDVEMLDALCDILFVGIYGFFLENEGKINLDSFIGTYDMIDTSENGIFKDGGALFGAFSQELPALFDAEEAIGRSLIYQALCQFAINVGLVLEIDLKGAYKNVVQSNFSKFPLTEDVKLGAELEWFNAVSKYDDVTVEEHDGRYIFRCDGGDGKIVKPRLFVEPELEEFIHG